MLFTSFHPLRQNYSLNTPCRLIYKEQPQTRIHDVTTSKPSIEKLGKKVETAKQKLEDMKAKLAKAEKEYNEKYGADPSRPYGKPITIDYADPDNALRAIDSILNSPYSFEGKITNLATVAPSEKRKYQAATLNNYKALINKYKEVAEAHKKAETVEVEGRAYRMVRRYQRYEKIGDFKSSLEKNKNYQGLLADYNRVFNGLLGRDAEFKRFYSKVELGGEADPRLARESQQLFFAILKSETNNFKTDFILNKMAYGSSDKDIEANKRNYPYIYHEWVKHKFDTKLIDQARETVQSKKQILKANNTPSVEAIANGLNMSAPDIAVKMGNIENPLKDSKKTESQKNSLDYREEIDALQKFVSLLNRKILLLDTSKKGDKAFKNTIEATIKNQIKPHIDLAKAMLRLRLHEERIKEIDKGFTRTNLSKESNRQTVLELMMRKFQKAMAVVDSPIATNIVNWENNLHSAVRRMQIATIFREGVARYNQKNGSYIENVKGEYGWLLSKLIQSKQFNSSSKEKFLNPEQRDLLIVARYANLALFKAKYLQNNIISPLETKEKPRLDRLKGKLAIPVAVRTPLDKKQIKEDIDKIREYTSRNINEGNVLTVVNDEKTRLKLWQDLINEAENLIKNPDRTKVRAYIEKLKNGRTLDPKISNKQFIEQFESYIKSVDLDYNAMELKEKSTGNYLDRMGIKSEGLYEAYLAYYKKNSDLKVDQWDNLLATKEGTKKLIDMFRAIIPNSSTDKGKKDFIKIFSTMHGINPLATKPEIRDDQKIALSIYKVIQKEIELREKKAAFSKAGNEAALEKLNGMTFGDKITEYSKGVINMLIGPGQSIANRAAGAAILMMAWSLARKAFKGEGKSGKALRILFLAGAAELAVKHITGEGLTDKLKLSGISKALTGTYEGILMDKASAKFDQLKYNGDSITTTEHAGALLELRNVPFEQVVQWYKETDVNGNPLPGKKGKLPSQIDAYNIIRGKVAGNREGRARFVLKNTIKNFFGYVAEKDKKAGGNPATGMNILNEVWVKSIKDKNFSLKNAAFASRNLPEFLLNDLRNNPKSVTWQRVVDAEVLLADEKKTSMDALKSYLSKKGDQLARWTRNDIYKPVGVAAKTFWSNVDADYAPRLKDFLVEAGKTTGRHLNYYSDKVTLYYEANKMTIHRIAKGHWELITEGVKLPFQILLGVDQLAVPFLLKKLKQVKGVFNPNKVDYLSGDLKNTDIVDVNYLNYMKSKRYEYFGVFGSAFQEAFKKSDKYYETPEAPGLPAHIAYLITETGPDEAKNAGVDSSDSFSTKMLKMQIASGQQAFEIFKSKNPEMKDADIKKYMYPIHMYAKKGGKPPEKLYTFWRMALPKSNEYNLIEEGKWADYMDPNKRKDRPPFILDRSKGILSNLALISGLKSPVVRRGLDYTTTTIAQGLRLYIGIAEKLGIVASNIVEWFPRVKPGSMAWLKDLLTMSEQKKQKIDEWLGSAGNHSLAISNLYKIPANAKAYQDALNSAIRSQTKLNLGNLNIQPVTVWEYEADKNGKIRRRKKPKVGRLNEGDFPEPPKLNE